jgi:hypothetical protein
MDCYKYRGIRHLSTAYKVLSNILFRTTSTHAEQVIGSYQCGYRKDRSALEPTFSLGQIMGGGGGEPTGLGLTPE